MTPNDVNDEMLAALFDKALAEVLPRVNKEDLAPLRVAAVEAAKSIRQPDDLYQVRTIPDQLKVLRDKYHLSNARVRAASAATATVVISMFRMLEMLVDFAKPSEEGSVVLEMGFGGPMFGDKDVTFQIAQPPEKKK